MSEPSVNPSAIDYVSTQQHQELDGGPPDTSSSSSLLSLPNPPSQPLHSTMSLSEPDCFDDDEDDDVHLDDLPVADAIPEGLMTMIHGQSASTDFVLLSATNVVPLTTDPTTGRTVVMKRRNSDIQTSDRFGTLSRLDDNGDYDSGGGCQRPSLISVHFFKKTKDSSLGLVFRSVNGVLRISSLDQTKPIASSSIRRGDEVISLDNHRHCSRWTALEAVQFIRSRQPGYLTLLLRNPSGDPNLHEAIVYRTIDDGTPEDPGIEFENDTNGRLRIKQLIPSGVIGSHSSALNVGDYVERLNKTTCTHIDASLAKQIVEEEKTDFISIVAKHTDSTEISLRDFSLQRNTMSERASIASAGVVAAETSEPTGVDISVATVSSASGAPILDVGTMEYLEEEGIQPRFIYVKCHKPTPDTLLGIEFAENGGFALKIDKINSNGILWNSPLREGFDVMAIDGKVCTSWTKTEATNYLLSRYTDITIVARNFSGTPSYVIAQAPKPSPRAKAGLTFRTYSNRPNTLSIGNVSPTGIFAGSILNEKDDVLSINGVPCRSLSASDACALVEHATDTVTVVARTNSNTGVVLAKLGPGETHVTIPSMRIDVDEQRSRINPCIASFVCCVVVLFFIILAGGA